MVRLAMQRTLLMVSGLLLTPLAQTKAVERDGGSSSSSESDVSSSSSSSSSSSGSDYYYSDSAASDSQNNVESEQGSSLLGGSEEASSDESSQHASDDGYASSSEDIVAFHRKSMKPATAEDAASLSRRTHILGLKVEALTDSMAEIASDLNTAIAKRRARLAEVTKKEKSKGVKDKIVQKFTKTRKRIAKEGKAGIEKLQDLQHEKNTKITALVREKGCIQETVQEQQQEQTRHRTALPDPCQDSDKDDDDEDSDCRSNEVKKAMKESWDAYRKDAWGWDELMPLSRTGKNWGRGTTTSFGLTIHDSLTTLLLMGLDDEFADALQWIETKFDPDMDFSMSVFESTIRMVGGLISAYELSGEKHKVLLNNAIKVADRILHAYNTSTGIPHSTLNFKTREHFNPPWSGGASVLAEFTTIQLELRTLSYHTGNSIYDEKATWIMDLIEAVAPRDYMCPTYLNYNTARWTSGHVTLGALGDSFFEYILKQYLLTGKTEGKYKNMYNKIQKGIMSKLLVKKNPAKPRQMTYVSEWKNGGTMHKMDHLACFAGGMLALGITEIDREDSEDEAQAKERDEVLQAAEEITETCYHMYHNTETGLAPEYVEFYDGELRMSPRAAYYLLRPEASEAFFYLWRITKKEKYRNWGWEVFKAIKRWCRVEGGRGYSGLRNVGYVPPQQDDLQQSFFLAETLKYLYLLLADDSRLDLNEWVLNTEAHPLKIRKRNPLDIWPTATRNRRHKDKRHSITHRLEKYRITNGNNAVLHPFHVQGEDDSKKEEEKEKGGKEEGEEEKGKDSDDGEGSDVAVKKTKKKKKKHHKHHKHHHHHKKHDDSSGGSS